MTQPKRVFISVAEDSADVHAAALVRAARERVPGVEFYGLTGPRLRELGVETGYDFASHAAMLAGVLGVLRRAYRAVQAVERSWQQRRPDLVVLIDSPELHLRLATKAKRLGIPVLYYIAPQTWASREYRNRQIVRDIDRLACILPFEEEYFARVANPSPKRKRGAGEGIKGLRDSGIKGFRAEYVGHPLFETLRQERPIVDTVEFLRGRATGRPIVAILPGSRRHVIGTMLPMQLEVIRRLRAAGRDVYAAISCVSEERREQIRDVLATHGASSASNVGHGGPTLQPGRYANTAGTEPGRDAARQSGALCSPAGTEPGRYSGTAGTESDGHTDADIDIVIADNASLLMAADLVLVASGTATLHVAYYRRPMIVMYDAGRLLHWPYRLFGRFVIKTPHLSLVNVLANARVVPEFMPFIRDVRPIAIVAGQLLTDKTWRELMIRQLDELVRPLEASQASVRVCEIMRDLLGTRPAGVS